MSLCEDMLTLVVGEANRYIGDMPDSPNVAICVYETGGLEQELDLNKNAISRPTFMIKIRDTNYVNGIARCDTIKGNLNTVTNSTINSIFYLEVLSVGGNNILGKDDRERWSFTLNFRVRRRNL